jgi:hypothetical protein
VRNKAIDPPMVKKKVNNDGYDRNNTLAQTCPLKVCYSASSVIPRGNCEEVGLRQVIAAVSCPRLLFVSSK